MNPRALSLLALVPLSGSQDPVEAARVHRERAGAEILAEFRSLLEIPNVAGDAENIRRNVTFLQSAFARRGVTMEALEIDGASPLLFGELRAEGAARTLGVYVHYDGQPVDPSRWTHDPWTPTLYTAAIEAGGESRPFPAAGEEIDPEWRLYARSAGDDKAPLIAWLAALDALREADIAPTVNVKFLFDGEEERGSPHLGAYIEAHRERLAADVWLFCDGPVHQSRAPALYFGVRGITGLDMTVYGSVRPLHSGHYGNFAPNPAERLAALFASMKEPNGRVSIEGFYDSTLPPGEAERAALTALPDYDDALRADLGLPPGGPESPGYFESLLRPSLNIRGFESGNAGKKARNVIPNVAQASIDVRLVAGNDPAAMLDVIERHIRAQSFAIVRDDPDLGTRRSHAKLIKIRRRGGYVAARTSMDLPVIREVITATRRAAGPDLLLVPTLGGSLPLYLFTEGLSAPIVIVPIANHDNNQHAADENLRLANLWYGIDLAAALLTLAQGG